MPPFKDLTGQRFGRLRVLRATGVTKQGEYKWECLCECGAVCEATGYRLRSGQTQSCGCYKHDRIVETKLKHGGRESRLYNVWNAMKTRCYNPKCRAFKHYGGRGIAVCEEWEHDFLAFKTWAEQAGYDEAASYGSCTLDRIDVDGNYEPENCRWVSHAEQQRNKRPRGAKKCEAL